MKHLYHSALSTYLAAALLLITIGVVAYAKGTSMAPPVVKYGLGYDQKAAAVLSDRLPVLKQLEFSNSPELVTWGQQVASLAAADYARRSTAYGAADPLASTYANIEANASTMAKSTGNKQLTAAGNIESAVNHLITLLYTPGQSRTTLPPTPGVPAVALVSR